MIASEHVIALKAAVKYAEIVNKQWFTSIGV
jgi:hypothetical protein